MYLFNHLQIRQIALGPDAPFDTAKPADPGPLLSVRSTMPD